ncbi:Neurotransmitter-gated ion-channel ligand binding domain protein [Ancylostoma caninum]|uniref:Neurotransmitter-gated ion-channel ligand binding domain protein n=1 Tax=Ancylostoma caninum TaxID=29170 RepID=A0A368G9S6_ANCCA|nr:Neurotransmitter-gated ion-channel ligand binding domain protein [Ancylostoma caninum]
MIAAVVATFVSAIILGSGADSVVSLLTNSSTSLANRTVMMDDIPLIRLTRDLLAKDKYDIRVRPIIDHRKTLKVHISISLYQIIEVVKTSIEKRIFRHYNGEWIEPVRIGERHHSDTDLEKGNHPYEANNACCSVKMSRDETERYMNIQVESLYWKGENGSQLSFLYPAIYTITCRLNIRRVKGEIILFFPYDRQNCTLTISSWTNSKSALDYYADAEVNLASYIPNEEWDVKSFKIFRHEYKYACCAEPWVILQASLVIQRKPLYYIVNLIIPTSIITIVSITGFFTPASTDDDRTEKINLGITTLLAMSILMLMVSDQMPTTSEFVPLIGLAWFYLSIIIIVSIGTFLTSVVLSVQSRRQYGRNPPPYIRYYFFVVIPSFIYVSVPPALEKLWSELDDDPLNAWRRRKMSSWEKTGSLYKERPPKSPMLERQSTLRVPKHGLDRFNSIQMIDVSVPPSPAASRLSRTPSMVQPQRPTLWEGTMSALAGTNTQLRRTSAAFSREVEGMRRKRQCSLEWEFLATVLDR